MSIRFQPYPEYKDSGMPWLGRVPGHWEMYRAKVLFDRMRRPIRPEDEIVTCFRDGAVTLRKNRRTEGFTNALKEIGYQGVRKGELVIHVMDAFAGSIGVSDSDGKCTPVYSICHPKDGVNAYFYSYLIREMSRSGYIQALAKGIRERSTDFRYEMFSGLVFPLPPPAEQALIVRFLEHQERMIRKYIRTKQKLIALLTEQKQAIIQRAVTRGLNPDVKLKPSGVPWLGDIPQHWELKPNHALMRVRKRLVGSRHKEYQLLSLTKRGVIIRDMSELKGKFSADMGTSQEVRSGDLVFCLFDVPETPRTIGLSRHSGMITGAYTVMECADPGIARFLEAFYIAMDDRKMLSPLYSGLRNTIPKGHLLRAKTPIPKPEECAAILGHIERETMPLELALNRFSRQISLMREYRTRLVSDVVTGKVDVRAVAARLPEVAAEEAVGEPVVGAEEAEEVS